MSIISRITSHLFPKVIPQHIYTLLIKQAFGPMTSADKLTLFYAYGQLTTAQKEVVRAVTATDAMLYSPTLPDYLA